jgi:hypothetical protein
MPDNANRKTWVGTVTRTYTLTKTWRSWAKTEEDAREELRERVASTADRDFTQNDVQTVEVAPAPPGTHESQWDFDPLGVQYLWQVMRSARPDHRLASTAAMVASEYDPGDLGQIITDFADLIKRYGTGDEFGIALNPDTFLIDVVADVASHLLFEIGAVQTKDDGSVSADFERLEQALEEIEDANKPPV